MLDRVRRGGPAIQLTSFVDVLFILLAFLLVFGSLERAAPDRLAVDLPRAGAGTANNGRELAVVLNHDGKLWAAGQLIDRPGLAAMVRAGHGSGLIVVVYADRNLPIGQVVTLLTLIRENGGDRASLAVLPPVDARPRTAP